MGSSSPIFGVKMKNIWNHYLARTWLRRSTEGSTANLYSSKKPSGEKKTTIMAGWKIPYFLCRKYIFIHGPCSIAMFVLLECNSVKQWLGGWNTNLKNMIRNYL